MEKAPSGKKSSKKRGRFKLVVFFVDHQLDRGFTLFSTKKQDQHGRSLKRFQNMILKGKFAGRVRWAGIYENQQEVWRMPKSIS